MQAETAVVHERQVTAVMKVRGATLLPIKRGKLVALPQTSRGLAVASDMAGQKSDGAGQARAGEG